MYAPAADGQPDLRLRSLGAYRLVEGRGVLSGYSSADLLEQVRWEAVSVGQPVDGHHGLDEVVLPAQVVAGGRGTARLCSTLAHASPYSGSPMESRLRMIIMQAGLRRPQVQWVVHDVEARTAVWLDMAWPEHRIGVEYEGEGHTAPAEVLRDAGRYTRLVDRGLRIYRAVRSSTCTAIPDASSPS